MNTAAKEAEEILTKVRNTEIEYIYHDIQDGACIGSGGMTFNSAKRIALMMVDMALEEAYKQGTEISLLRQEHLGNVKSEIEKMTNVFIVCKNAKAMAKIKVEIKKL